MAGSTGPRPGWGAPLSGLHLGGVPVEALAGMTPADLDPAGAYSRVGWAARAPAGTPLGPAGATASAPPPPGPPARVAKAVADLLAGLADGVTGAGPSSSPQAAGPAVEAGLAFAEAAAARAGGPVAAPAPAGWSGATGPTFQAALTQVPYPPWLPPLLAASRLRGMTGAAAPDPQPPGVPTGPGQPPDPVALAAAGSAYWLGQPPFGPGGSAAAALRARLLAQAASAPQVEEPGWDPPGGDRPLPAGPSEWTRPGAEALAALADGSTQQTSSPQDVGPAALADIAEALYAGPPAPGPGAPLTVVVTPQSAAQVLAAVDVMADYQRRK